MTKEEYLDEPPASAALTAYDQAHLKLYLRLLDAEADGAAWEEVVRIVFGLDPVTDPNRAAKIHAAHLARAKWMTENGFCELLGARLH
ncbi:DUF2285 domain-containing protein [Sandaracinobacter sp. RS1-74]|uniref:DUF2285 domain-containing protein n=1 Tax=Sandaracinobacteroides sayramensis TaxID=2913411 RepID=UPI001EDBD920|nr:DUF2285 domain-containing protein [Sandaracinobacteroides sayramensis]